MNSLEVLNNIRDYIVYRTTTYNEALNNIYKVEQDLEVLEILKKAFSKEFLKEKIRDVYINDKINDNEMEQCLNWLERDDK